MPIPESEAFKAKKPKVLPTFDGVDYDDTRALKRAQDAILREQWIRSMENRIIGEELNKCYYKHGINHFQECAHYRNAYLKTLKDAKVEGYLLEMKNSNLPKGMTVMGTFRPGVKPVLMEGYPRHEEKTELEKMEDELYR